MRCWTLLGCAVLLLFNATVAPAFIVVVDYSYDTSNFFPAGSQARDALEAAASFYSQILNDTFSPVTIPERFVSQIFDGEVWWTLSLSNPSAPGTIELEEAAIAADEFRIYAGAQSLPGPTAGHGGFGAWGRDTNGGGFTQQEYDQFLQIDAAFEIAATTRGEASGFASWGGSISFDTDADNNWHFDSTTPPPFGTTDLYSVAIHELGHALGLGSSDEWDALAVGSGSTARFVGAAASAIYGGDVPLAPDLSHWVEGTMSTVFGSQTLQEASLDPSITKGTRKRLTSLDAAALTDIGWTVLQPAGPPGDYNHNHVVDAADYTVWRNSLGQSGTALAADGNGDTHVDGADYLLWKMHFGEAIGSGSAGILPGAAPEPGSLVPLTLGAVVAIACGRLRRSA